MGRYSINNFSGDSALLNFHRTHLKLLNYLPASL